MTQSLSSGGSVTAVSIYDEIKRHFLHFKVICFPLRECLVGIYFVAILL